MKQRITYLVSNPDDFNPELLNIKDASLSLENVKAAKEHRFTLGLDELPEELQTPLEKWNELHIRWASEDAYEAPPPFTSRVTPGLHVSFAPKDEQPDELICPLLKDFFGGEIKCNTAVDSFTKPSVHSKRSSTVGSLQYFHYLPSLSGTAFTLKKLCPPMSTACKDAATSLLSASYLDVDYEAASEAVVISVFWDKSPVTDSWTESIFLPGIQEKVEVGVLSHEKNPDPEDIAFAGFLTVLGQDTQPKPTRFQTPTRHYPLSPTSNLTYTSTFSRPTGLHPTLLISLPTSSLAPPERSCKLYSYLTLPSTIFVDKYAFSDALFLDSHHLKSLRSISGATDLEAPDWVVPQWGSAALFELATPSISEREFVTPKNDTWEITIPLHLRYLPAADASHTPLPVPWPVVFWACRSEEDNALAGNPFDRRHLGYESLFGEKTRFIHVPPATEGNGTGKAVSWIDVPILDLRKTGTVGMGTVGVVVMAFLGLCWVLFSRQGMRNRKMAGEKKTQ